MEKERAHGERKAELSGKAAAPLTRVKGPRGDFHHLSLSAQLNLRLLRRTPTSGLEAIHSSATFWFWTRLINQQTLRWTKGERGGVLISPTADRGVVCVCVCLCVIRVACNGEKWTEKWNRTRGLQLGEDVHHAGDPAPPSARTPRSRPR